MKKLTLAQAHAPHMLLQDRHALLEYSRFAFGYVQRSAVVGFERASRRRNSFDRWWVDIGSIRHYFDYTTESERVHKALLNRECSEYMINYTYM